MMFPRFDVFTRARNNQTGRLFMLELGWYRFTARLFRRELADWLRWRIAFGLPRSIALLCFVRVCGTADSPSAVTYEGCYRAYERGAGR